MFKGLTALVTGSTSGIGLGIATSLAANGANKVSFSASFESRQKGAQSLGALNTLQFLGSNGDGEGIPALIKVVETSKSAKLKKDAIFYLSQSRDPRALDLFEKLLSGK